MPRLRLQLAAAAIFLLAWTQSSVLEPKHESGILPIDPPTPYVHYWPEGPSRGRALVVHGLDVSKEVMHFTSTALADGGFEVYNIDLPGHGDSRMPFQADLAEQAVWNAKAYLGDPTIVVGHSLGADMLLDLAETNHFSTMVLLAPPPIPISRIHADRVLIATGAIDVPVITKFAPIAADIGGPDVETWILPWGGHSAPIFTPAYVRRIVEWLGGDGARVRTLSRMIWIAVMFVGTVVLGATLLPAREERLQTPQVPRLFANYIFASGAALLIMKFVSPLKWLRLFTTDYLIGFFLLTGLALSSPLLWRRGIAQKIRTDRPPAATRLSPFSRGRILSPLQRGTAAVGGRGSLSPNFLCKAAFGADVLVSLGAAVYVILVPGLLVASRVLHMTLSDGRWWRFPCIALASLPFFLADELTIRQISSRWKSAGVALLTRGLLVAFLLTGVLTLNRENGFLVMIVPLIGIFWFALWFASGVVYRHTRNPLATALFAAIVQGWAFAAWFVTI